ncbi:MAG: hypothetical protein CMG31_00590 [Candidatus Marinimicrobia bacterium]|nr:hypothetical protein [Candidatus Neomarinimicrobiota bacterium]
MDKNTVLAFLIIALILMGMPYYYEMIGLAPPPPQEDGQETGFEPVKEPSTSSSSPAPSNTPVQRGGFAKRYDEDEMVKPLSEEKIVYVETPLYVAGVSSRGGGSFVSFVLKNYPLNDSSLVDLVVKEINQGNLLIKFRGFSGESVTLDNVWELSGRHAHKDTLDILSEAGSIDFFSTINGQIINKAFTFNPGSYTIGLEMDLQSVGSKMMSQERFTLIWRGGVPSTEPNKSDEASFYAANLSQGREITKHNGKDGNVVSSTGRTDWTAVRSKYFTAAIIPTSSSNYGEVSARTGGSSESNGKAPLYDMAVSFSSAAPAAAIVYLGPLQYNNLKSLDVGLENSMSFGISPIRGIGRGVLYLLKTFHGVIPNYGVVLIIFSVLVKIVVYPLTKKSYQSMKAMQILQPEIAKLKDKYQGDPQRLNKETMKMYKERGVNPLGGCLPMLLQMPLLFALFIVFRSTIELRGAPFVLWIDDLSQPDALIPLPFSLPLYGSQISLLPLLMGVSMFVQQKMSATQANPQQKMMTQFMSVFFVVLFNQFPSGLNLYYTLFNVLTILQQKYMVHPKEVANLPKKKK